jgi:hypothetical protein
VDNQNKSEVLVQGSTKQLKEPHEHLPAAVKVTFSQEIVCEIEWI